MPEEMMAISEFKRQARLLQEGVHDLIAESDGYPEEVRKWLLKAEWALLFAEENANPRKKRSERGTPEERTG